MPFTPNRRGFLMQAGAVALAGSGLQQPAGAAAAEDVEIRTGRHLYKSLKWNMIRTGDTVLEKFLMLKDIGYDGVELNSPDDVDKSEALEASRETGLPIEGIVNARHWKVRHSDPDPKVRAQALRNMETALHDAKLVGADSVLLVPGKVTDPDRENHQQVRDRSIADLHRLIPLAKELQVMILIENVGNGFCEDPRTFARYIDEIDSPWVAVHYDIGNHIWQGRPSNWIRVLGSRIRKIDVKDRTRERRTMKIGDGHADWPEIRKALADLDYQGWVAAEVPGGDRQRLTDVLARMNRVLGKSDGQLPRR